MINNELKAKISEELKAQGINASDAQIEAAIAQVTSKQELTEDAMENVAGGVDPATIATLAPLAINFIKKLFGGGDKKDGKGGGTNFNNTNDGGKQMNNQGTNNKNDNSGAMNW